MWPLYWLVLVSYLPGYIVASEYHINDAKATWEEAYEFCQINGSILAVLDSQEKINDLAGRIKTLGYGNDMFWIGLMFNASIGQFVWSTGDIVQEEFLNSTCVKKNGAHSKHSFCYALKKRNHASSCFEKIHCLNSHTHHQYGYICQNDSSRDTTPKETPTFTMNHSTTISRTAASSILQVLPTATTWKTSSPIITSNNGVNEKTHSDKPSTVSRTAASSILQFLPTATTWKTSSPSITSNNGVNEKTHSDKPLQEFSSTVASLNPEDPLSLKLVTDAYRHFMKAFQSNTNANPDESLLESARVIEEFAFRYASFNLNRSQRVKRMENQHIVLQVSLVPKGYNRNFTFAEGDDTDEVARITLPSYLFQNQDTVVVNALYWDLYKYVDNLNSRNRKIDSSILGSSVKPSQHEVFTENVTIVLRTLEVNDNSARKDCVFWKWNFSNPANGSWSGDGCSLVETNSTHIVCSCNHLTNFAILMDIKQHQLPERHKQALKYITYIGLGISLLGETITILAYMLLLCVKHDQQSHVHVSLVTTLAMAHMIFLAGIDETQDQVLCISVAALIHYFYLSSFCWMLIEGVLLYLLIIEVYNTELKLPLCYCFSFGFPGLVVGGTLLIAHLREDEIYRYKANKWCWLSTEKYYIWSFAAPVILITTINFLVFCGVVKEMVTMPSTRARKLDAVKTTVKACIVLFPLLGVTWLFGLLSLTEDGVVSQYIFTVLNSLQGLLIFLLHCVRNTEIRSAWYKKLLNMKKRACQFLKIGRPPSSSSTTEAQSCKPERSEVEMSRRGNRIAPVEG